MDWYYAVSAERKGPLSEEEFQRLVQRGVITPQTLVWREGFSDWQPYGASGAPASAREAPAMNVTCNGCGGGFAPGDVIQLADGRYCAACKPLAVQRLKEGLPANTAAEGIRKANLSHEASVQSIGLLYYLGGAIVLCVGGLTLLRFFSASGGSDRASAVLVSGFLLALGAVQLWVGTGLRRLRKWARIPTGVLSGIGLLGFPLGTLINAYVLYLVFSQKGKMVFSDEYQAVIQQTPHIKYRTSMVVWILFVLLVLIIGVAIFAAIFAPRR
jgi:hypothetical protein